MLINNPIADMLARIRNACMRKKEVCDLPHTKFKEVVLKVLKENGYIADYEVKENVKKHKTLIIHLKYYKNSPVIVKMRQVSKQSRRVYRKLENLPKSSEGLGIYVLSTSAGVMTDYEARSKKIGGEILFEVF